MTKMGTALTHLRTVQYALDARGFTEESGREVLDLYVQGDEHVLKYGRKWEGSETDLVLCHHEEDSYEDLRLSIECYYDAIAVSWSEDGWSIDNEIGADSPLSPLMAVLGVEPEENPCTESDAIVAIEAVIDYFVQLSINDTSAP